MGRKHFHFHLTKNQLSVVLEAAERGYQLNPPQGGRAALLRAALDSLRSQIAKERIWDRSETNAAYAHKVLASARRKLGDASAQILQAKSLLDKHSEGGAP